MNQSSTDGVYVIGGGGHAKVVIRLLQDLGHVLTAVFDDDSRLWGQTLLGVPVIGPIERVAEHPRRPTVIAVGNNAARRKIAGQYDLPWLTAIHPRATVDATAELGPGTVVLAGAVVQASTRLGKHVIVNTSASVDHDCSIGNFAHIAPGVRLAGTVKVGEEALIGIGATAIPGVSIGNRTTVGASAAVVSDLPDGVVAMGVPAKETRYADRSEARSLPILRPESQTDVPGRTRHGESAGKIDPPANPRIYLSPPHMSGQERDLLLDAFDSNWIAPLGPHVTAFEQEFAARLGVADAAALSSGTAALHLALLMLGVEPGDSVCTSTLTFAATANAITYLGAEPVFIDSDPRTWNMDPGLLAEELQSAARRNKLPKAVVVVDLYGQCADYGRILDICRDYNIPVVEDAAEALGARYQDRPAGTFGVIGCFSFNGNKIITTSGGGMLTSDRKEFCERARFLASQARDPAPHYQHSHIGYNYRMSNLLAAVGRGQLAVLDARVAARRANYAAYHRDLADLPGIDFMPEAINCRSTRWLTCVTIDPRRFGATREDLRLAMESENIEARPVWKPLHLQPIFRGCRIRGGAVSEDLFGNGLCLPSGSSLTQAQRERVIATIHATHRASQVRAAA